MSVYLFRPKKVNPGQRGTGSRRSFGDSPMMKEMGDCSSEEPMCWMVNRLQTANPCGIYIALGSTCHVRGERSTPETCAIWTGSGMMSKPRGRRNDST